jgi:hypothetical protein
MVREFILHTFLSPYPLDTLYNHSLLAHVFTEKSSGGENEEMSEKTWRKREIHTYWAYM